MAEWAVLAAGLTKSYRGKPVLAGLDLQLRPGGVFALLGPNGAGKTTAVRVLATLTRPDGGRASVAGFDVVSQRSQVRRVISLTGQYAAVDEALTGTENLALMGRLAGLGGAASRARATELLGQFDLADAGGQRVGQYSGGMRRRLDLAAGLVGRPEVIFLDEPTTGLDPRSRQALWRVVAGLAEQGVTVLLTTQYLPEADELADQVAVLNGGRIVAQGSPSQLKRGVTADRLEVRYANPAAFDNGRAVLGNRVLTADASRWSTTVRTSVEAPRVRALLDELDPDRSGIRDFEVRTATLDDVFFALTAASHG